MPKKFRINDEYDFNFERFGQIAERLNNHFPKQKDGKDGDMRVINESGTPELCIKINGIWYAFEGRRLHAE